MNKSYVYVVTNKIDGKRYVGKTDNPVLRWRGLCWKNGSSTISRAISEHGIENFEMQVLSEHDNESDAYQEEARLINELDLRNPEKGYNRGAPTPHRKMSPSRYTTKKRKQNN